MRRSRIPVTAWPAFADLMTILAVVGLAIGAGVLAVSTSSIPPTLLEEKIAELQGRLEESAAENANLNTRIEGLEGDVDSLRDAAAVAARLRAARIEELEGDVDSLRRFGQIPCLGTQPEPPSTPVSLLRIVVAKSGYGLTEVWLPPGLGRSVNKIPKLREAIDHAQMDVRDFERYARLIYDYGDREDTFGASCRFFVEIKNETESLAFARAFAVVSAYFLISNSSEVIGILRGSE